MIKTTLIIVLLFLNVKLYSQYDDFATWSAINIGYDLNKKTNLSYTLGHRTEENAQYLKKLFNEVGINHDIHKNIRLGFEYRNTFRRELDNSYDNQHRIAPFIRFSYKVNKEIRLDFRTQYQFETRTYTGRRSQRLQDFAFWYDDVFIYDRQMFRIRPRIRYKIDKVSNFNFSYEAFFLLSREFNHLRRERFVFEYERKLTDQMSIDVAFLYQYQLNNVRQRTDNVIKVGYNYSIN